MRAQGTWKKALVEFGVIVLGVLVALAADRWRESLDDTALRERYLANLIRDVRMDVDAFQSSLTWRTAEYGAEVLRVARGYDPPPDSTAALAYAIEYVQWYNPPVVTRETYDDLVSTGNLVLLEPEVRRVLGQYYDRVTYYQQREQLFSDMLASGYRRAPSAILGPELHPELFDRIQARREARQPEVPDDWVIDSHSRQELLRRLRSLTELESWVAERIYVNRQHVEIYGDRMTRHAEALVEILEGVQAGTLTGVDVAYSDDALRN